MTGPNGYMAPPPPPRRPSPLAVVVAVVAVAALALAGFVAAKELWGADADVVREPVATAGANPFMPSVGAGAVDVRTVAHSGGTYSGDTEGLYGGTGDDSSCDRGKLARFLSDHPDRAAGWAGVLGVQTGDVSRYVDNLTSVVLRSDTYVTNHGWSGGTVTSYPAVLQAGTAVLVDQYGTPVTRCFCGNPLTAPSSFSSVSYVGPTWVSFSTTNITVVAKTSTVVNDYTIVDVHNGEGHSRPRGSDGDDDEPAVVGGSPPDTGTGDPQEGISAADPGVLAAQDGRTSTPEPTTTPPGSTTTPPGSTTTTPESTTPTSGSAPATPSTSPLEGKSLTASGTCPAELQDETVSFADGTATAGATTVGTYTPADQSVTIAGTPFTVSGSSLTATSGCTLS